MSYTVEELKPANTVLLIDGKELELSLVTLQKEVIFAEKYGSFQNVFIKLKEKPEKILEIIYELVLDKTKFKNSLEVFKHFIFSITSKEKIEDKSRKMYLALEEASEKSAPKIVNLKRYKEIQKIKGEQADSKPCYASYYDSIAKRYGYSLDQFYDLTLRQLHILLKVIGEKTYDELEIQAALQGRKLKPRMNFEDVTPEQDAENENQAMEALKELQRKYQEKQADKEGQ